MQRLSYPTETVLPNKVTRNRIVQSFKDSPRKSLRRRPIIIMLLSSPRLARDKDLLSSRQTPFIPRHFAQFVTFLLPRADALGGIVKLFWEGGDIVRRREEGFKSLLRYGASQVRVKIAILSPGSSDKLRIRSHHGK